MMKTETTLTWRTTDNNREYNTREPAAHSESVPAVRGRGRDAKRSKKRRVLDAGRGNCTVPVSRRHSGCHALHERAADEERNTPNAADAFLAA